MIHLFILNLPRQTRNLAITDFNFCIIVNYVVLSCICSVNRVKIIKLENLKLEKINVFLKITDSTLRY